MLQSCYYVTRENFKNKSLRNPFSHNLAFEFTDIFPKECIVVQIIFCLSRATKIFDFLCVKIKNHIQTGFRIERINSLFSKHTKYIRINKRNTSYLNNKITIIETVYCVPCSSASLSAFWMTSSISPTI
jgi:hypothetical protein